MNSCCFMTESCWEGKVGIAHPGQVSNLVRIQQKLLERTRVPVNIVRHGRQVAVSSVHIINVPVAGSKQWNTAEHGADNPRRSSKRV